MVRPLPLHDPIQELRVRLTLHCIRLHRIHPCGESSAAKACGVMVTAMSEARASGAKACPMNTTTPSLSTTRAPAPACLASMPESAPTLHDHVPLHDSCCTTQYKDGSLDRDHVRDGIVRNRIHSDELSLPPRSQVLLSTTSLDH